MTIWFDMDGTIADLYGVENWLDYLIASDPTPYTIAKPLLRLSALARILNNLQRKGYKIGVISWLAKHLASVAFDEINIVKYGFPKHLFATCKADILFDDEEKNRNEWTGKAFDVNDILGVLKGLD